MVIHILVEMLLLGLLLIVQASGQARPPLSGCAKYCGDIVVLFPFGIGPGCFLDEWYEIDCRNGFTPPVPVLEKTNLEVLSISLEENAPSNSNVIEVKYPMISNAPFPSPTVP
ncbi:hypothetical protein MLD38_033269 [Melastoma candidum]|uniref:Uncharacterized protein n=1 Tax=Melastoma candidum TaxID=119954 RepID=A0ACB9M8G3_9MYRT|nr:hypothetical protein MLD38_033269 [Melastoma candidum]